MLYNFVDIATISGISPPPNHSAVASEFSIFLLVRHAVGLAQPMAILESIKTAKEILEFLSEWPEWINYNKNLDEQLQNLRMKWDYINSVQADVKTQLENTEIQSGKKRKREVDHWLSTVKGKAVKVRNVKNHINSISYLPRFLFRAWLGSCITKEIQQLNELLEQGKFPEGLLGPQHVKEPFVINMLVGQVVGEKLGQIWAHLINPTTVKIGVQGTEGMGKSIIMAHVFNWLHQYCCVYYVNVPQNFSIFSLQAAIAAELNINLHVQLQEGNEYKRASRIFNVLKKKEFVLILDGLPQDFHLDEVGIPSEGSGQKMILTSRSLAVCRKMSCQETVILESLSQEDAEELFMVKLAPVTPLSEDVRDVAHQIVTRCNGIPSTIISMADQLRGVLDIYEWRTTLNEM